MALDARLDVRHNAWSDGGVTESRRAMYGGNTSSSSAARRVVAFVATALALEVIAAFLQPLASWIPTLQVAIAAGVVAAIYGVARYRIPTTARSMKSIMNITGSCLSANHDGCGKHLACPCLCHDNHIQQMMARPAHVVKIDPLSAPAQP
jgi:hypothetical protein